MTRPTINSQISLGNIIQMFVIFVALTGGWFAMQHQTDVAASASITNAAHIEGLDDRVRSLETRAARDNEQVRTLQRDIGEIKEGQREINTLLRQLLQRGDYR